MRLWTVSDSVGVFQSFRTSLTGGWAARAQGRAHPRPWSMIAVVATGSVLALWIAVRTLPWFGPLVADGLRAVLGVRAVALLEQAAAGAEDRVRLLLANDRARSLSEATPAELARVSAPPLPVAPLGQAPTTAPPAFRPADVGPMHAAVSSAEDGVWAPVALRLPHPEPGLYRTMLHPDPRRAYAELFVFAIDVATLELHASAGSVEPKGPGKAGTGLVRPEHRERLVAAFNGGFKAEHGRYGMAVDGRVLLPPRPTSCTLARRSSGALAIAPWPELARASDELSWWRQTPPCMLTDGELHDGLRVEGSTGWGATIDGDTVIRRSAVGLSADGGVLFVGISNSTTARALAKGMQHAGAHHVAQLDVNFSYPKFVLYRPDEGGTLVALSAVKGFLFHEDDYLRRPSTRDFFYLTLRRAGSVP